MKSSLYPFGQPGTSRVDAPRGIKPKEDEEEYRKAQQRRPTIADVGQWNPDDRYQSDDHPDVDGQVEEKYAGHAVAIDSGKA